MVRNSEDQIPTQLLTVWCDNKLKSGAPLQNNKKNLAQNIRLIVPGAAKDGLLTTWVYISLDDGYWAYLVRKVGLNPLTMNLFGNDFSILQQSGTNKKGGNSPS